MNKIYFEPLTMHKEGIIFDLLKGCYMEFNHIKPEYLEDWKKYDYEIHKNSDTVGACGFVTYLEDIIIGFASWDPREYPIGIIGHNCILAQYRGNGYGNCQIYEIIKRLKQLGFQKVLVSTMDHEFFEAAQKMYLSCGFSEKRKFYEENKECTMIEYEQLIT